MWPSWFGGWNRAPYVTMLVALGLLAGGCGGDEESNSGNSAASGAKAQDGGSSTPAGAKAQSGGPNTATPDGGAEEGLPAQCASICQKTEPLACPVTTTFVNCTDGCLLVMQAAQALCPARVDDYTRCVASQPTDNFECSTTGFFMLKPGVCNAELNALNSCNS